MDEPILSISKEYILSLIEKVLGVFKEIMGWFGILVLPEEGDYDYPET